MAEPKITTQAAHVSAGSNLPINRIVVHATCPMLGYPKASARGQAAGTARYFTDQSSGGSAHYVEDIAAEEHCVKDSAIAWHAPPNPHSVGVEICADGGSASAYGKKPWANYTREDWLSEDVWPAVRRAALRIRELCDRFDVPKVRRSPKDLLAGKRGICGHDDVSQAWHQTDHSDPGPAFPWDEFMAVVTDAEEDDMTPQEHQLLEDIHDRLFGIFPQNYMVTDANGVARSVAKGTPGARPARGLDELAGNYIVRLILAGKLDLDELAAKVAAKVGGGASAADIAAELLKQITAPKES